MLNEKDILRAKENIEEITGKKLKGEITLKESDVITVTPNKNGYEIGADSYTALARAMFSIMKAQEGFGELKREEKAVFDDCGIMLDCSRNAVSTVETLKKLIRFISASGMNYMMLYTEDTYEIPEVPFFGYMRGRYSISEIQEVDAYAKEYGIELVPCIQTLSHLKTFLKYAGYGIKDTDNTLLCDEEKTYEFIENAIKAVRKAFSSKRIHIGMDEAFDLGKGKYFEKHGLQDGFEIINKHLGRVTELCKKYDFTPMMWSDMFFCLGSAKKEYYDVDVHIDEKIASIIPDCAMVFWDYYHLDQALYDKMLENHLDMKKPIYFAGGISSWYGLLPRWETAYKSTVAGLNSCVEHDIKTVFATMWGDDGNECNLQYDLPILLLYSEYMYNGLNVTDDDFDSAMQLLCGYGIKETETMGTFDIVPLDKLWGMDVWGKQVLYTDPLYQLGVNVSKFELGITEYTKRIAEIDSYEKKDSEIFKFARLIYSTATDKLKLMAALNSAYENKDKSALAKIAETDIPALINSYSELAKMHRAMWMKTYKPFGYEHHAYRYGGAMHRLNDVKLELEEYLEGKINSIPELEEKHLDTDNRWGYAGIITAGVGI